MLLVVGILTVAWCIEIQHDEIEALRSIYMDDFAEEEAKTGAWNKTLDRRFKIKLRATNSNDDEGLILEVCMPPTYPKSVPRLTLAYGPDIRQNARVQAQSVLASKPKSLIGSEMIYEIATSLQDILDNTWTDPSQIVALDEERAARDAIARDKALADDRYQREQERQSQLEEERILDQMVKLRQTQIVKRSIKPPEPLSSSDMNGPDTPETVRFERNLSIKTPNGRVANLATVHKRTRYSHGPACELTTVDIMKNLEGDYTNESVPFLLLKECHVSFDSSTEAPKKRLVQNLESKLEHHMGLEPHQSIMKPLNYRIQKSIGTADRGWNISILMELAERRSLRETLNIVDRLDVKLIRAWSIQLIEGLQHYHRHGITHADVHPGNIMLQRDREAERGDRKITVAKLSDGGYQRDLHVLKRGSSPSNVPLSWIAPQSEDVIPATDIWDLGLCFLQMAFGVGVLSDYQSPNALLEELKLTESVRSLLNQVLQIDPKKRPSAWDLLHFEFFRTDDGLLEGDHPEDVASLEASTPSLLGSHVARSRRESVPASTTASRYSKDFAEDGRLGRGGFGEVFRARNKVEYVLSNRTHQISGHEPLQPYLVIFTAPWMIMLTLGP